MSDENAQHSLEEVESSPLMISSDPSSDNSKQVASDEIGWGSVVFLDTLSFLRRTWLPLLVLALVVVIVDVAVFYKTLKSPQLRNVDINVAGSQATITSNGYATKSSLTTSFDVTKGSCDYLYRVDNASDWQLGGEILAIFPSQGNSANEFNLELHAQDTHFGVLRRISWDMSTKSVISSALKLSCSVDLTAQVYGIIPLAYTYKFDQVLNIVELHKTAMKTLKAQRASNAKKPSVTLVPQSMDLAQAKYQLVINFHKKPKLVVNNVELESFVVHIPQLSYATSFVDHGGVDSNYLVVQSQSVTFDLAQYTKPIAVDIALDCTPVAPTKEAALAEIGTGKCTLLSPIDFNMFASELTNNQFMNVTAQANLENFVMSFLGDSHYLRTIDNSLYPGNQDANHRALAQDPAISTGSNCVTVDSDGVYVSQFCSEVDAGFFKLYVGIYSDQSYTGYLHSTTSWAPASQEVAFESNLDGLLTISDTDYGVMGDFFFSQDMKLLTFLAAFNETQSGFSQTLFTENMNATWEIVGSSGVINSTSSSFVSGVEPITADGQIVFDSQNFTVSLLASDTSYPTLGDYVTAYADGSYDFTSQLW
jgi:hypothetical protein